MSTFMRPLNRATANVNVTASSDLIRIVDQMKAITVQAEMALKAVGQASGPGCKGSTDIGLPQQH